MNLETRPDLFFWREYEFEIGNNNHEICGLLSQPLNRVKREIDQLYSSRPITGPEQRNVKYGYCDCG